MRIKLTKIGNSWGVRLPKNIMTECGFQSEAELDVRHKMVILSPVAEPRDGWEDAVQKEVKSHPFQGQGEWKW